MLNSIVETIKSKQGGGAAGMTKTAFKLPEIILARTPTKTIWNNFSTFVEILDRSPEHILSFYLNELGCDGQLVEGTM